MEPASPTVTELQGLYGPFSFPELLLQKLWWRREFSCEDARTADGRALRVIAPGRWNRLGGPDFRDAVVELDGVRLRGAVEVHLRAEDWGAHRHSGDPAYDGVILHVVLFPPRRPFTPGAGNRPIPILSLLPLLWHDLEEYAADEAVASLLNRAEHRIAAELAPLPPAVLHDLLVACGERRWRSKLRYASKRVARLGWSAACHQTALEILGYRSNRAAMLRLAAAWPLNRWAGDAIDPDAIFASFRDFWALQGVRPANHPRVRVRQYARWTRQRPDWPARLATWGRELTLTNGPTAATATVPARRQLGFPSRWESALQEFTDGAVTRPRADHLLGDGFLPLAVAHGVLEPRLGFAWWWHGYPGDLPDPIKRALRELGLAGTPGSPASLGTAQALVGWLLERELKEPATASAASRQGA